MYVAVSGDTQLDPMGRNMANRCSPANPKPSPESGATAMPMVFVFMIFFNPSSSDLGQGWVGQRGSGTDGWNVCVN